jgi:hypothetical protein
MSIYLKWRVEYHFDFRVVMDVCEEKYFASEWDHDNAKMKTIP